MVKTHETAAFNGVFVSFQLNKDCLDEIPPDYDTSVGGPPTNPISGASEITVNESSVVLDHGLDLQQLHPDAEIVPQTGESHVIASSMYIHFMCK